MTTTEMTEVTNTVSVDFCLAPHPYKAGNPCRRIVGHDGDHSAYTGSIATPETWDASTPVDYGDDEDLGWDFDDDDIPPPIFCRDCDTNLMPNTPLGSKDWQRYMVHDQVWADAGMDQLGGWLCIPCLETRIARPLTGADLKPDLPLNCPDRDDDDTPQLAQLKRAIPNHRCALCDETLR
jgi:hypothetical protein